METWKTNKSDKFKRDTNTAAQKVVATVETRETVSHHPEGTSMDSDNRNTISLSLGFIMAVPEIKICIINKKEEMRDDNNTTEIFHTWEILH